ncbi:cell division protein FtsL [Thalassotalea sp. HSM 43]|uniref:cell division protein FtsL n=1 Tax=Thalassotalea sp. HSM 43 TaxID=2552945 RepID=UPI001080B13C|nr:cell division protein FtsL [Thalassotalea sp. HSM 43]QBY04820.1 cell division protein FtsL [Thalassotalea sp. HSM 43]
MAKLVLTQEIWQDIKRYSGTYIMAMLVLLSAFAVIYMTHINRQATSDLEKLYGDRDSLHVEWRNLQLEQNSLAEHSEIETKADKALHMHRPEINSEIIIKTP